MTLAATRPAPPGLLAANLICMASMMIWAAGLPAAELLIPHVPPIPLAAMRLLLGAALLLPLWWLLDGWQSLAQANWGRGIVVGGICLGIGAILLIYAQAATDAVTVAVISATAPVVAIALKCLLEARKVTARLIIGLVLSLIGGLASYAAAMGSLTLGFGALAALGSVVAYTWGSRATVTSFPSLSPVGRTAITVTGAAIVACMVSVVYFSFGGDSPDWAEIGWPEIGALGLYGAGAIAVSQLLWIMAVGQLGIGMSSLHLNAAPFYVMILLFLLGGAWSWPQAIGAAVVGLGVLIAQGILRLSRT